MLFRSIAAQAGSAAAKKVRLYWSPTAAMLDELPKAQRVGIAEPFVESATFASWSRLKSAEATREVLAVVTGTNPATRKAMAEAAATWVHPLLAFEPIAPVAAPETMLEHAEAAE